MRFIHFKAPFGAFRPFKNVELATTAEFVTYSAAYGLLLGLAGIERQSKNDFVGARLALGCKRLPRVGRTFQQLIQGKRELTDHPLKTLGDAIMLLVEAANQGLVSGHNDFCPERLTSGIRTK